jgi:hypothetical protein
MAKVTLSECWNGEIVTTYPECPYADLDVSSILLSLNKFRCTHPKNTWRLCDCAHMKPQNDCPFGDE